MSGASGVIYGIRLLEYLSQRSELETHLILTKPAERTIVEETDYKIEQVKELAAVCHAPSDIGASIASGSFPTDGMAVVPCSIHTVSSIAYCHADNLLTRAADVTLKERRRLVLVVRETPLHRGHLKAMLEASESGAIILPPVPAFYTRPKTLEDLIHHTVGRILDQLGIAHQLAPRWGEEAGPGAHATNLGAIR
jgi:4-hydroxy-3-polyprenylbenzoate decarboxylase